MVNRPFGEKSQQLHNRHARSDFETKTQDGAGVQHIENCDNGTERIRASGLFNTSFLRVWIRFKGTHTAFQVLS